VVTAGFRETRVFPSGVLNARQGNGEARRENELEVSRNFLTICLKLLREFDMSTEANRLKREIASARVRDNCVLSGELAQLLIDLRMRGRISTYTDGIMRGLVLLQEEELRLQTMRARLDLRDIRE